MNSVADVWDNVLQQLKKELSETTIATWFDELEAVDIQGSTFLLHCSNDFKKGYIETLFMKNIKAALRENGAVTALMTGSGAAVFGVFRTEAEAKAAADALRARWPQVYTAQPVRGGACPLRHLR